MRLMLSTRVICDCPAHVVRQRSFVKVIRSFFPATQTLQSSKGCNAMTGKTKSKEASWQDPKTFTKGWKVDNDDRRYQ